MARLGQRVEAGEALAQAGEAEMQAGNFILTNGSAAATSRNDTMIAAGEFRVIYQGTASIQARNDTMSAAGAVVASTIDVAPPGDIPAAGMRDVWMYQTSDDGNVYPVGGDLHRTNGLETAVYLSLFGGNPMDDGLDGNRQAWWGNDSLEDEDERMVSRFQNLVEGAPLTSGGLLRYDDAAAQDLAWIAERGATVEVGTRITGIDRYCLEVRIDGEEFNFTN